VSGRRAFVSQELCEIAGLPLKPMLLPAVEYQYTPIDSCGELIGVAAVTTAFVSTAPIEKQEAVVDFLAATKR